MKVFYSIIFSALSSFLLISCSEKQSSKIENRAISEEERYNRTLERIAKTKKSTSDLFEDIDNKK